MLDSVALHQAPEVGSLAAQSNRDLVLDFVADNVVRLFDSRRLPAKIG